MIENTLNVIIFGQLRHSIIALVTHTSFLVRHWNEMKGRKNGKSIEIVEKKKALIFAKRMTQMLRMNILRHDARQQSKSQISLIFTWPFTSIGFFTNFSTTHFFLFKLFLWEIVEFRIYRTIHSIQLYFLCWYARYWNVVDWYQAVCCFASVIYKTHTTHMAHSVFLFSIQFWRF